MNEKWIEEIKRNDEMTMLDRYFPGKSCGNAECEKHYIQILQILRALNIDHPKYHAVIGANVVSCGQNLKQQMNCRFAPIASISVLNFTDSQKEYVFRAGNNECEKCKNLDGIKVSQNTWKNEGKMNRLGFWKQNDGTYKPHPHCKCRWVESPVDTTNESKIIPAYKLIKLLNGLIHVGSVIKLDLVGYFSHHPAG